MTSPTISSTAIDAFVAVEAIQVVGRHRRDLGDLASLALSIDDLGLLNPVTLTRAGRLIAGQRRLEACRSLGWDMVPVRFVDNLDDAVALLKAERDENTQRKDMLPSEKASLGASLHTIEAENARARQRTGLRQNRQGNTSLTAHPTPTPPPPGAGQSRDAVGNALGMTGRTYQHLYTAHSLANDDDAPEAERALARAALEEMDTKDAIWGPGERLAAELRSLREPPQPEPAAMPEPEPEVLPRTQPVAGNDWIPASTDKTRAAVQRRRDVIRELAPRGHSSHQIADRLGLLADTVRRIAHNEGIELPADRAMGRNSSKTVDSNRIVRVTVQSLADAEMALNLVNFAELDRAEMPALAASLTKSIRVLTDLKKRLKEIVREHQA